MLMVLMINSVGKYPCALRETYEAVFEQMPWLTRDNPNLQRLTGSADHDN